MVNMTTAERQALGRLAQEQRTARFDGLKKDVYSAAGVNPATLDRIEQGLSVKDRSLAAVVRTLWPSSEGDWRRVLAGTTEPAPVVDAVALTDEQLIGELARRLAAREDVVADAASSTRAGRARSSSRGVRAVVPTCKGEAGAGEGHESVKRGDSVGRVP